jgi:hypothetical protein
MRFATAVTPTFAEKVYRSARNSSTKTLTATAATIARGAPVILATNSASVNGYDIQRADTASQLINNLFVGIVAEFPDTTINQTGTWGAEDVGAVQCYGYNSAAILRGYTDTLAQGLCLIPNTGQMLLTNLGPVVAASTGTTAHSEVGGIGCLVVLAETVATVATSATNAVAVHIRAM